MIWMTDPAQPVPGWVVALAVLAGLLLLALLIFIMYKVRSSPCVWTGLCITDCSVTVCEIGMTFLLLPPHQLGFFKRVRPPQEDCTEKEQLQPEENGNTDA